MKTIIYAIILAHVILILIYRGLVMYKEYLDRQLDDMIEKLGKEEDEEDNDETD